MAQEVIQPTVREAVELTSPIGRQRREAGKRTKAVLVSNIGLVLFGVMFLLPLLWLFLASFDSQASFALEIPHFTLENFRQALANGGTHALLNSLVLALVATLLSTVAAFLAAYALVRHRIPWKGPLLLFVLFLTAIPMSVLIIPVYEIFVTLGWLSILPSAVFLAVTSLPYEIWLLKNYLEALPEELEEAARVENASTSQILLRIILPLALPGIGAAAIFGFVNAWGSFIVPLVLISSSSQTTGPVAIFSFLSASDTHYGDLAAFSLLYSLPVFLIYLGMSRLFVGGFTLRGAMKG
jgi:multiple sugar transport system permease protein